MQSFKILGKVVLEVRESKVMIHERIPYVKSKSGASSCMQSVKILVKGMSEDRKGYVMYQLNS